MTVLEYFINNIRQIVSLLFDHTRLTFIALGFAIIIGVPLGILISYYRKLSKPILGLANLIQAVPSMALLGLSIPLLGIGVLPAVTMVILYSLLPIIKNTFVGIDNINKDVIEAAKGIGLTKFQILLKVQFPLALPVIMGGIRISAVTAVGLMTIAAFIGAGGLGYLIFSGIRTVNNYQILAGAIPACILALIVDFVFAIIEKQVTPISLQKTDSKSRSNKKTIKRSVAIIFIMAAIILFSSIFTLAYNRLGSSDRKIIVAGKDFTEQTILTHMIADFIEDRTDITVQREPNLGGTQVCFSALVSGDIDLYIEYTGTAYGDFLNYPPNSDMEEVYQTVKKDLKDLYDLEVLKQFGFNNTYTLAVTQEVSEEYQIRTISDLAEVSDQLIAGTTLEFLNREDGIPGLKKHYDFEFMSEMGIDGSPRYVALINNESHVIDAFATDGLLKKFNLVVLEDDKGFFPPYYAIPIVRKSILDDFPEIEPLMEELGQVLTDDIMSELNYKVDELQLRPEDVAHDFLIDKGLIKVN